MKFKEYIDRKWKHTRIRSSAGWKDTQDTLIEKYIFPIIGEMEVSKITEDEICAVILSAQNAGLSDSTVRHIYNILFHSFKKATRKPLNLIEENPVNPEFHRPKVREVEKPFMHPKQSWWFLEQIAQDDLFGPPSWFQLLTGTRRCEVIGVLIEEIDWKNNCVPINRHWVKASGKKCSLHKKTGESCNKTCGGTWVSGKFVPGTKNGKMHLVPIPTALKRYLFKKIGKRTTGWLFLDSTGQNHINYDGFKTFMRRAVKKFKLPIKGSHGLRHSSTVLYSNAGANLKDLSELLNHSSDRSTRNYVHTVSDRLIAISKNLKKAS